MTDRRYSDEEVREIFRLATADGAGDRTLPSESGALTLSELKHIGEQVGIEPARVAQAAERLDLTVRTIPVRRMLGMPVGLTRVVDLPRAPTDREWELMVSEFRTVFETQGHATTSGGLREWSHGNLHISVEPTARGQQLRLSTLKDDGVALNVFGVTTGAIAVLMASIMTAVGKPEKAIISFGLFGGFSLISFLSNLIRLPVWARERGQQMEEIAAHVVRMLSAP